MELGPWTNDPRIIRQTPGTISTADGHLIAGGDEIAARRGDGEWVNYPDIESGLRALLGEPRTPLVHALATEFTVDQLRGMASAIAEEGWSDTGTAFEVLRSALVAAARVG